MGLVDRGHLWLGTRADVIAVNAETRQVELTLSVGRLAHLLGPPLNDFVTPRKSGSTEDRPKAPDETRTLPLVLLQERLGLQAAEIHERCA